MPLPAGRTLRLRRAKRVPPVTAAPTPLRWPRKTAESVSGGGGEGRRRLPFLNAVNRGAFPAGNNPGRLSWGAGRGRTPGRRGGRPAGAGRGGSFAAARGRLIMNATDRRTATRGKDCQHRNRVWRRGMVDGAWLAWMQGGVRKNLPRAANDPPPLPSALAPLGFALLEVFRHYGRALVCWGRWLIVG